MADRASREAAIETPAPDDDGGEAEFACFIVPFSAAATRRGDQVGARAYSRSPRRRAGARHRRRARVVGTERERRIGPTTRGRGLRGDRDRSLQWSRDDFEIDAAKKAQKAVDPMKAIATTAALRSSSRIHVSGAAHAADGAGAWRFAALQPRAAAPIDACGHSRQSSRRGGARV
jgi:hypothetical protein